MGSFLDVPAVSAAAASSSGSFARGRTLGRYTLIEPLGAGGMGAVFRARDEKLGQDTYERRHRGSFPGGAQNILLTIDWYKDVARSVEVLAWLDRYLGRVSPQPVQ